MRAAGIMTEARNLHEQFVHLGLGATAEAQPPFTGMDWYADYVARTAKDGSDGRLVSLYTFSEPWDSWEMHPHGAELVVCTRGTITLIQDIAGENPVHLTLSAGQYAINPAGVWHTADVDGEAEALFITSGVGTEHRPR
jgi:mannose-6-phosphate isomerase-like protein (cupin superfamily)